MKFRINPRNKGGGGRERFTVEGMVEHLFKNIVFFLVFWLNFQVRKGTLGQNGKMGSVLTIQGQMVKIPLQSPGKLSIFPVLALFLHLSLPKIWHANPQEHFILEIYKDRSVSSQSLES